MVSYGFGPDLRGAEDHLRACSRRDDGPDRGRPCYTGHETLPKIMRRTLIVGVGGGEGRGVFTLRVCAGLEWEVLDEGWLSYRRRIEVIWNGATIRISWVRIPPQLLKKSLGNWHFFALLKSGAPGLVSRHWQQRFRPEPSEDSDVSVLRRLRGTGRRDNRR